VALTFILGGARSGKSDLAARLAAASGRPVLFLATMEPGDEETRARIMRHRAERPPEWRTIEAPIALLDALAQARNGEFVVIDCLTLWLSNLLVAALGEGARPADTDAAVTASIMMAERLARRCSAYEGDVAVVSNEVGAGVVPAYPLGRAFRDALGGANRALAASAGQVYWTVAGLALDVKRLGASPIDAFGDAP
jgi:adenosylcobinamide kinase/adenosylcobinamide-phosphate guanylyltransferase